MKRRWKKCTNVYSFHSFFYWNCVAKFHLFSKAKSNASARICRPNQKFNFIKCRDALHARKPSTFKWTLTRILHLPFTHYFASLIHNVTSITKITTNMWMVNCVSSCISLLLCRLSLLNCLCGVNILNWRHPSPSSLN